MNNELKIGDEVKVLNGEFLGETGIINSIDKNSFPFGIKFQNECFLYWFNERELEKVENFQIGEEVYINGHGFVNEKVRIENITEHSIAVKTKNELIDYFDRKYLSKNPINQPENQPNNKIMKTEQEYNKEIQDLEDKLNSLKKQKEEFVQNNSFEVGDWIVWLRKEDSEVFKYGNLYEIVRITDKGTFQSRFSERGVDLTCGYLRFARKATEKEIEDYLISLAKESGLDIGKKIPQGSYPIERFSLVKIYQASSKCDEYIENCNLKYCLKIGYGNGGCSIPFDYIAHLSNKFQPKININGYDAEFFPGYVKFGCAKFDNSIFQKAKDFIEHTRGLSLSSNSNRKVENIKLGAGTFTPTDIDNIVKRLKS